MRRILVVLPVALLLFAGSALSPSVAEDMSRLEKSAAKQRARMAKEWLGLAAWLAKGGYAAAATDAAENAASLDPEAKGLEKVQGKIEAIESEIEVDDAATKKIAKAKEKVAKGYEKLAKIFEPETKDPRYTRYMLEAYLLAPSKTRLVKVAELAKKKPLMFSAPGHPMAAYITFPKSWKPGKSYPVLVSVDGAGANFKGNATTFRNARGSREWITVSPHALSCTNEIKFDKFPAYSKALIQEWNMDRADFDVPGLATILEFLSEHFGASRKVAITGFSGGGLLCYGFLLRHPDRVLCAAPACANFNQGLASGAKKAEDGGPPVHIMTGENDPHRHLTHGKTPPGIEQQTDWAVESLEANGFSNVKRTMLPGVGHSALAGKVWAFVDEVTEASK